MRKLEGVLFDVVNVLFKTGGCLPVELLKKIGAVNKDFVWLKKRKYITEFNDIIYGRCYELTTRGYNVISNITRDYTGYKGGGLKHDVPLAYYLVVNGIKEPLTVTDFIRRNKHDLLHLTSIKNEPDLLFYSSELKKYVALEIVTPTYTKEIIGKKIEWCQKAGVDYVIVDTAKKHKRTTSNNPLLLKNINELYTYIKY